MDAPYFFDPAVLVPAATAHRDEFAGGDPFPHVVIDDFMPVSVMEQVVAECPDPGDEKNWVSWSDENSVKKGLREDWSMGPATRHVLSQLNGGPFITFLEELSGIEGLIPDPHFLGGGLHTIERGGYLRVHADFNFYPRLKLERRLNVLLYLNHDWQDEWGGHLELWDATLSRRVQRIAPIFNRLVVFATTDTSFHGHPHPLACPPGTCRRSLALYYYTNGRPEHEQSEPHSVLWKDLSARGDDEGRSPAPAVAASPGSAAPRPSFGSRLARRVRPGGGRGGPSESTPPTA